MAAFAASKEVAVEDFDGIMAKMYTDTIQGS